MKKNSPSLKTLTKSSVWDYQENDIFRFFKDAEKDADLKEDYRHYLDIIRSAFEIDEIMYDKPEILAKIEARGFRISEIALSEKEVVKLGLKKRPISRVTDLTYENIRHISASKLLEVIDRNFGGGWDSLSQAIQDVIMSGFDVSTTTLPQNRLHNAGGMYSKMVEEGFEVLEIVKGNWVEAIFAKAKPVIEKADDDAPVDKRRKVSSEDDDDDDDELEILDSGYDDDDDDYDEDKLTEESYRTTYDTDPDDLTLDDVAASEDDY